MRDLDRLLTNTFPEELKKVPPALVDKKAVAAKTFEKLGLEQPAKHPRPQGEWVSPTPYRRRPWAVLAACLMLAVLAGVGITLRPMLTSNAHQEPLPAGTYLECAVAKVSFDQEQWAVVLDLEAKTDLDLDHPDAPTGYDLTAYVSRTTSSTRSSLAGLNQEALTHWTKTGEDTYRCENITLEIDPVFQAQNQLMGEQDLNLELFAYFGEKNAIGTRENYLMAETSFTVDLPSPLDAFAPSTATYFDLSVSDATFDQPNGTIVLTLEAKTDMELDNETAQLLFYSWFYSLYLGKDSTQDVDLGDYAGADLDFLTQWTQTGEETYRSAPVTIPIPSDFLEQSGLKGTTSGSLHLTVSIWTKVEIDPVQFFSTADFTVELPGAEENHGNQTAAGLLKGDDLATYEKSYGQPWDTAVQELGLSENQVTPCPEAGLWETGEQRSIADQEFEWFLLSDVTTDELYGYWYRYQGTEETQILQTADRILSEAQESYGEPTTYPGSLNRLSALDEDTWNHAVEKGQIQDWYEEWSIGENTRCTLTLTVMDNDTACVLIEYRLAS